MHLHKYNHIYIYIHTAAASATNAVSKQLINHVALIHRKNSQGKDFATLYIDFLFLFLHIIMCVLSQGSVQRCGLYLVFQNSTSTALYNVYSVKEFGPNDNLKTP